MENPRLFYHISPYIPAFSDGFRTNQGSQLTVVDSSELEIYWKPLKCSSTVLKNGLIEKRTCLCFWL